MLKKTIAYTDYNGVERKEDFYFNLNKAEITKMELSHAGGLSEMIKRVVNTGDNAQIVKIFQDLILMAYGEKSDDGKRFVKSKEIADAFSQTEAYSELFMELAFDADKAAEFVNGIIPADVAKQLQNQTN